MQIFSNPSGVSTVGAPRAEDAGSSSGASSASSTGTNTATVTANDFLQLLVTELQNQDPTANTDPNEFINQLVQVNSLQQLIQINQDLTPTTSSGTASGSAVSAAGNANGAAVSSQQSTAAAGEAAGNLSAPNTGNPASRITTALSAATQTLAPGSSSIPLDSMLSSLRVRAQQASTSTSTPAR
jgi:flagellar basal-body rod modification protein FlgD